MALPPLSSLSALHAQLHGLGPVNVSQDSLKLGPCKDYIQSHCRNWTSYQLYYNYVMLVLSYYIGYRTIED